MSTFRHYIAYALAGLAIVTLLAILASILLISVGVLFPQSSTPAGITGSLAQALSVARSYLFRHALRNTLIVLTFTLPLVFLLGFAGVALVEQSKRSHGGMAWLLLLPLAMPFALTMPAWRQIFAPTLALAGQDIWPTLLAVAAIQAWRILPFATLFLLLAWPLSRHSPAIGLTLCFSAYVVLSDAAVVLLLNGGAPFNASHLLASWIYQTGVAGGLPVHSAVMALLLVPLLALSAWGIVYFSGKLESAMASRDGKPALDDHKPATGQPTYTFGRPILAGLAMIAILLPLSVPLVMSLNVAEWPNALRQLFGSFDHGYWLANIFLMAGITALAAVTVAPPLGRRLADWKSPWSDRLSSALGILGLVTLPISFVPLTGLQSQLHLGDGRWLLTLIYASAAICIGTWLVALMPRRLPPPMLLDSPFSPHTKDVVAASPRILGRGAERRNTESLHQFSLLVLTKWLVLLSFLIVTQEMAAALVLSNGQSRTLGLGSGMANRMLFDPSIAPTVIGLAILLPTVLLLLFYWRLLRGSIDPLMKSATRKDSQ